MSDTEFRKDFLSLIVGEISIKEIKKKYPIKEDLGRELPKVIEDELKKIVDDVCKNEEQAVKDEALRISRRCLRSIQRT